MGTQTVPSRWCLHSNVLPTLFHWEAAEGRFIEPRTVPGDMRAWRLALLGLGATVIAIAAFAAADAGATPEEATDDERTETMETCPKIALRYIVDTAIRPGCVDPTGLVYDVPDDDRYLVVGSEGGVTVRLVGRCIGLPGFTLCGIPFVRTEQPSLTAGIWEETNGCEGLQREKTYCEDDGEWDEPDEMVLGYDDGVFVLPTEAPSGPTS